MTEIDYDELDPGIRDRVRELRARGYETTDSGDGVSKPAEPGEVLPFPHIAVTTTPARLLDDASAIWELQASVPELDGCEVQASFDPRDRSAIILVTWQSEQPA
jgi:hypothetical protein